MHAYTPRIRLRMQLATRRLICKSKKKIVYVQLGYKYNLFSNFKCLKKI